MERNDKMKYKILGKTGLSTSICGFGSYRVDYRVKEHSQALEYALKKGINLIDTSANYTDGGSEMLIGRVVNSLIDKNELKREDVIIVSKGGYIQGENMIRAKEREEAGNTYPETVKCAPDLWHSIHPEFLSDQISLALERLNLNYIDVYLLHNPEYFLTYSGISDEEELRNEYYARIEKAFAFLETEVEKGRIKFYGVSSNTFGEDAQKRNFTSLEKVIDYAGKAAGPDNHFAIAQLPLNLFEKGGAALKNQNDGKETFLETAERNNIGVLVNRPLNAIIKNKLQRLTDYEIKEDRNLKEIIDLLNDLNIMEDGIKKDFIENLKLEEKEKNNILESASLSMFLKQALKKFEDVGHFREIKGQYLVPRANYAVNETYKHNVDNRAVVSRLNNYALTVNITLDSIESYLAKAENKKNEEIHRLLSGYIPEGAGKLTLSEKAVLMVNSLPGVSCTLVGMRTKKYVDDILGSIQAGYVKNAKEFFDSQAGKM